MSSALRVELRFASFMPLLSSFFTRHKISQRAFIDIYVLIQSLTSRQHFDVLSSRTRMDNVSVAFVTSRDRITTYQAELQS